MKKGYQLTIWIIIIVSALFTSCIIFLDASKVQAYKLLYLLPLVFAILTILSFNNFSRIITIPPALIIYVLYFLRNVATVIVMHAGNYAGYFNTSNMDKAIYLMIYEMIMVFFILNLSVKKYHDKSSVIEEVEIDEWIKRRMPLSFSMILFTIITFMVIAVIVYPSIKELYVSLFDFQGELVTESVSSIAGNQNRIVFTLFSFWVDFMRILLPVYLFKIIRRFTHSKRVGIILSLPVILLQFMFVGATSALAIYCAFIDFFVLLKLYPKYRKRLLVLVYIGAFFSILIMFVTKFNSTVLYKGSQAEALSEMFQAYFSGPCNIAACFNMPKSLRWWALLYDLYYTIPFNGTLFGLNGITSAEIFNFANSGHYQIIPCVGQVYYFFGMILAPIVSMIMCYYAVKIYNKSIREHNVWIFVSQTLLWFYLCISPIMYNGQIFINRLTNSIIPCILITYFSKRYREKRINK